MANQFRQTDAEILSHIVDYANQRYLRQSRIHKKSSFNILRVLSAYKQTCQQYSPRKDTIYNWILYITKHFNPQSLHQWQHAITQLTHHHNNNNTNNNNTNNSNTNNSNNNISISYKNSHHNTVNNVNKSTTGYNNNNNNISNYTIKQFNSLTHLPQDQYNSFSQHVSQIMPNHHNNNNNNMNRRNSKISSYEYQYGFQQSKSNSVSNSSSHLRYIRPISSNMHYISFEPDHQNKQNVNSQNTKSQHNTINIKQDNQPTRTPIEQSFIHNLPLSYGSPFITSKITNNTKQVTQIQQEEQQTEQWVNMKARADIFHQINLNMKAFSALLANFQAFQIFQCIYAKTKKFKKQLAFFRFINSFDKYKSNKQIKNNYYQKAYKFYATNLIKKSFKILNVLYQLKINQQTNKKIDINKFNRFNYQFLMSIMFCPTYQQGDNVDYVDAPKSIRHKSKHFQLMEDCQKMQMITQYFSCNLKLSKQQISMIFQMRNKVRKQQAFQILKKNVRSFQHQRKHLNLLIKKTQLKIFTRYLQLRFSNTARIKLMDLAKAKKIKQKCFKALYQFQMSKKIYAKRQQYLTNYHRQMMLKNIIKQWKNRKQQKYVKKQGYQACVKKGLQKLKNELYRKSLGEFLDVIQKVRINKQKQLRQSNLLICKQVFNSLKSRVVQRKMHMKIKQKSNLNNRKQIFKLWLKQTKINMLFHKVIKFATKSAFKQIKQQSTTIQKTNILLQNIEHSKYQNALKQLRIYNNLQKKLREQKSQKAKNIQLKYEFAIFKRITTFDKINTKIENNNKELNYKSSNLQNFIKAYRKKLFLSTISQNFHAKKAYQNKKQVIKSAMGIRLIPMNNSQNYIESQQKYQTYTPCHKTLKKQAVTNLRENLQFTKNKIKLQLLIKQQIEQRIINNLKNWKKQYQIKRNMNKMNKIKQKNFMNKIAKIAKKVYDKQIQQNNAVTNKHNHSLLYKSLLGLAKATIHTNNLINILKKNITCKKFNKGGSGLIKNLKKDHQIEKCTQKLNKKLFIKRLRNSMKTKNQILLKQQNLIKQIKLMSIKKIKYSHRLNQIYKQAKQFEEEAYKKFAVMKVNRAVFRQILHKKQIYMAFKFRAIQLCKHGFKGLFVNCSVKHQQLAQSKKYRIHEHISTSYSSL